MTIPEALISTFLCFFFNISPTCKLAGSKYLSNGAAKHSKSHPTEFQKHSKFKTNNKSLLIPMSYFLPFIEPHSLVPNHCMQGKQCCAPLESSIKSFSRNQLLPSSCRVLNSSRWTCTMRKAPKGRSTWTNSVSTEPCPNPRSFINRKDGLSASAPISLNRTFADVPAPRTLPVMMRIVYRIDELNSASCNTLVENGQFRTRLKCELFCVD